MNADAKVDQSLTAVRDIKAGELIKAEDVTSRTVTTVTCHNPKCGVEITWCQEDIAKDQDAAPEAFFRILTLQRSYVDPADQQAGDGGKYPFCSAYCLIRWLESCYEPSVSPAEKRRRYEALAAMGLVPREKEQEDRNRAIVAGEKFDALKDQPEFPAVPESGITMPTIEVAPLTPEPGSDETLFDDPDVNECIKHNSELLQGLALDTGKDVRVEVPGVIEDEASREEDLDGNSPQWN